MTSRILIIVSLFLAVAVAISLIVIPRKVTRPSPAGPVPVFSSQPSPSSISTGGLTPTEQQLPEATPLPSTSLTSSDSGSLVVVSDPSEARILIDPIAEGEGEGAIPSSTPDVIPIKITPFKISSIPAGKHILTTFKQGYIDQTVSFEVKSGDTTRLNLQLQPLP